MAVGEQLFQKCHCKFESSLIVPFYKNELKFSDYDFTCESCKVFMIVVKDQVANPNNEQAVAEFLKQLCATIFPGDLHMQGECKVLIILAKWLFK